MNICIIGGYGKMGLWLARRLQAEELSVTIAGRDIGRARQAADELGCRASETAEACSQSETVIFSVPIASFDEIVADAAPHIRPGALVLDVTSVKAMPVSVMHRHIRQAVVLGTHPMFGPGAQSAAGQRFVLTPTCRAEDEAAARLRRLLEERGGTVTLMTPAEHDELMSIVLGLSHFIALASAETLLSLGRLKECWPVAGTTYKMLLTMAQAVASEDAGFYSALQMSLPGLAGLEKTFIEKAAEWQDMVHKGRASDLARRMAGLKEHFAALDEAGLAQAYRNMYKATDEGRSG
jgi:prephenate dehydrogenase